MSIWTLSALQTRVRELLGRYSPLDLTSTDITKAINQYYQLIFPQEVMLDPMEGIYEFYTVPYQGKYEAGDKSFRSFLPEVWVNHAKILFSQHLSRDGFSHRLKYYYQTIGAGDGVTTQWNFTLPISPISPNTFIAQAGAQNIVDSNPDWTLETVGLQGNGGGSLNYTTGVGEITFNEPPVLGELIEISYSTFSIGFPSTIVMFDDIFYLFPVPDKVYRVEVRGYKNLPALVSPKDALMCDEWGLVVCYGTCKNLLASYGEMDAYGEITVLHREMLSKVVRRTQENMRIKKPISFF